MELIHFGGRTFPFEVHQQSDVDTSFFDVLETLFDRSLVGRDIVFHRDDLIAALPKSVEHDAAIIFQVFVNGRQIDRGPKRPGLFPEILAGCSESSSSKAVASEDRRRTLWGTLRI